MTDQLCINSIRAFSADMVQKAKSGHPGAPMGMAPMAHVLWSKFLNFSAKNPNWYNRDRFVLSNGHGCALLYSMLHLCGYSEFPIDEIKNFRQLGSNTPGHPENHFDGIEVTTGPLGQGFSNAVGLAIAEEQLAAQYNKDGFELFNNHTYVFCGDGCMMEGVTSEAASLAGHLSLGKLIVLYDDNKISIDGSTDLAFTENVAQRFDSYGWQTLYVADGDNDVAAIAAAIEQAKADPRPSLISVRTTIGWGSSKEGTAKAHGSPLGDDDLAAVKTKYGLDPTKFFDISDDVRAIYNDITASAEKKYQEWSALFAEYNNQFPELGGEIERRFNGVVPEFDLPTFTSSDPAKATRQHSQACLNVLTKAMPELIGGSADLSPSNGTTLTDASDFQKDCRTGRNIRYGVREHAMGSIVNGLAAYGAFVPFGATFLNFLGYMQGAVTLSALSNLKCFYIMTHDSIGLGEDGPTHQPVEKFMEVRATPNILLIRPADGNETSGAYKAMLQQKSRPSVLCFSRQALPNLEHSSAEGVLKGAYTVVSEDPSKPLSAIIVATGSEVSISVDSVKEPTVAHLNIRVVSMPCWELFDEQSMEYRMSVLPDGVPVLSVEAGVTHGWQKYAHAHVGLNRFGVSAPGKIAFESLGFTSAVVAQTSAALVDFYADRTVMSRVPTL